MLSRKKVQDRTNYGRVSIWHKREESPYIAEIDYARGACSSSPEPPLAVLMSPAVPINAILRGSTGQNLPMRERQSNSVLSHATWQTQLPSSDFTNLGITEGTKHTSIPCDA